MKATRGRGPGQGIQRWCRRAGRFSAWAGNLAASGRFGTDRRFSRLPAASIDRQDLEKALLRTVSFTRGRAVQPRAEIQRAHQDSDRRDRWKGSRAEPGTRIQGCLLPVGGQCKTRTPFHLDLCLSHVCQRGHHGSAYHDYASKAPCLRGRFLPQRTIHDATAGQLNSGTLPLRRCPH